MPKNLKLRSLLIGGIFSLFFVGLIVRLYWVQVVQASWLLGQAQVRWEADKTLAPTRGEIVDRKNEVLAGEAPGYTVSISPKLLHAYKIDENEVADRLAAILKMSDKPVDIANLQAKIRDLASRKRDDGTYLEMVDIKSEGWKIDKEQGDQVTAYIAELQTRLHLKKQTSPGIYVAEEKKRYYPGGTLAAHVIGYNDKDGNAKMGMEKQMDKELRGVPGRINYEKDRDGIELPDAKVAVQPAVDGYNVRLTIDKNIQFYIENAMAKVAEKFNPKSMAVIAADPRTMEILGMASYPTFDPNKYWLAKPDAFLNRNVAAQFEPGSTFKLVTLTGTVKEGLFHPNDTYQSGQIAVPGRILHDHNDVGWGRITYLEGLKRSSNVAFVKLGYEMLGQDKLYDYIKTFGFGVKTNIDISGEVPGVVNMKNPSEFATATYGQGLTVTAIQQAAAYGAIANGGKLMWPHIVKDVVDPKTGKVVSSNEPKVIRQVVDEATAKQVSEYLEQVVSDQNVGTGRMAYIDGYRIAGKTGTANFVPEGAKTYAEGHWNISFAGYAPVENPQILITIIVEDPDLGGDYHRGGEVGPPLFREIMAQSLAYLGIPSSKQKPMAALKEVTLSVPDMVGMAPDAAKQAAGKFGLTLDTLGKGGKVVRQFPLPGTQISGSQRIAVALQDGELPLPDLTGRSLREAVEMCAFVGVPCQTSGTGYVVSQNTSGGSAQLQLRAPDESGATASTSGSDEGRASDKTGDASKQQDARANNTAKNSAMKPDGSGAKSASTASSGSGSSAAAKVSVQPR